MNVTWSQVIDYFQTPENMMHVLKNNEYIDRTYNYYNDVSDWMTYHKYQAIGSYPELYGTYSEHQCFVNIIYLLITLWLIDNVFVKPCLAKARYFVLHTIVNAFVVYYVWNDVCALFTNPIRAFNRKPQYDALDITVALHFYHVLFFKGLTWIDWVHHVPMMGIAITSYYCPNSVIVTTNGLLFFLNGLPGGLDYFLLTLVKYNIIHPIKEKELNSYLNIWIRSPGVLFNTYNMYLTTVYANYTPSPVMKFLILAILTWNAQYFTYRVIGNYFTKLSKKANEFERRVGRQLSTTDLAKCIDDADIMEINEKDVVEELVDSEEVTLHRIMEDVYQTYDEDA
jgi:hypothetical protein